MPRDVQCKSETWIVVFCTRWVFHLLEYLEEKGLIPCGFATRAHVENGYWLSFFSIFIGIVSNHLFPIKLAWEYMCAGHKLKTYRSGLVQKSKEGAFCLVKVWNGWTSQRIKQADFFKAICNKWKPVTSLFKDQWLEKSLQLRRGLMERRGKWTQQLESRIFQAVGMLLASDFCWASIQPSNCWEQ